MSDPQVHVNCLFWKISELIPVRFEPRSVYNLFHTLLQKQLACPTTSHIVRFTWYIIDSSLRVRGLNDLQFNSLYTRSTVYYHETVFIRRAIEIASVCFHKHHNAFRVARFPAQTRKQYPQNQARTRDIIKQPFLSAIYNLLHPSFLSEWLSMSFKDLCLYETRFCQDLDRLFCTSESKATWVVHVYAALTCQLTTLIFSMKRGPLSNAGSSPYSKP